MTQFDRYEDLNMNHELHGYVLVMDGEHVVAIIYHCSIPCDKATKACQTTLWVF